MTFVDNLELKANIMIDDEGVPLIKDQGFRYSIGCFAGLRWTPPEVHCNDEASYTTMSDIYSLGMTILEVMTGNCPYFQFPQHTMALSLISGHQFPLRPENFPDEIWSLLVSCWDWIPERRPTANVVLAWLDVLRLMF